MCKVKNLNFKLDLSNTLKSDLKLNIELTKRKQEAKSRIKAEKKEARAKKSKRSSINEYEDKG